MLWCQGAQNIGLSNRKLKSGLKCTMRSHGQTDGQMDGQTDEHNDNSETIPSNELIRARNKAHLVFERKK